METKPIRKQAKEIQNRFFQAFDMLEKTGKIKSLQDFCRTHELHRPKYSNLRGLSLDGKPGTGYKFIDIDALSYLVQDYEISSEWLLLGTGGMFRK
jgi:hypothetical protein